MHPLLRPRWIVGHLLAVAAVVGFVLFGMWQLRRHDEKVVLRDQVASAMEQPVLPIAEVGIGAFARVSAAGTYLGGVGFEAKVLRSRDGVSGYEVLTPLVLDDGTAVLVDRGWVRLDLDYRAGGSAPPGVVELEGILWPRQEMAGESQLAEFISRIDPEVFERALGLEFRPEYLVALEQTPPFGIMMAPPEVGAVSLGPHMGYAIQWFLFAAVVLVGYPLLLRKRSRRAAGR